MVGEICPGVHCLTAGRATGRTSDHLVNCGYNDCSLSLVVHGGEFQHLGFGFGNTQGHFRIRTESGNRFLRSGRNVAQRVTHRRTSRLELFNQLRFFCERGGHLLQCCLDIWVASYRGARQVKLGLGEPLLQFDQVVKVVVQPYLGAKHCQIPFSVGLPQ